VRGLECNTFDENSASNGELIDLTSGLGTPGIEFVRAHMRGNSASEGLLFASARAAVTIDGSLIAANTLGSRLILNDSYYTSIVNSTIAANTYAAGVAAVQMTFAPSTLVFEHDLFADTGHPACAVGTGTDVHARDDGVGNASSRGCLPNDPLANIQVLADPFVGADAGDFHIRRDSSAVDRWQADPQETPPALDLDGVARPQAIATGTTTPYDFGAYEVQPDAIFIDGFDG
jgi:hypothetical protein